MEENKKIQIVGAGISESVAKIIKDKGLNIEDIIVIDSTEGLTPKELIERIKSIPNGKTVLIQDIGVIASTPLEKFEIPPNNNLPEKTFTIKAPPIFDDTVYLTSLVEKKNFGGHKPSKNQKLRRK